MLHCVCASLMSHSIPVSTQVPSLASGEHRQIPHLFGKGGESSTDERKAIMANVLTPMRGSATFKKMLKKQARVPTLSECL